MEDRTHEMAITIKRQTQKILELHETVRLLNAGALDVCVKNAEINRQRLAWRAVAHRLFQQRNVARNRLKFHEEWIENRRPEVH